MAVVFAGLLNRIMLTELAFPGLLVGGALAFEQLVAPSRVLFGQISDAKPFQGRYRVPYILTGAAFYCLIAVLSIPLIFFVGNAIDTGQQPRLPGRGRGPLRPLCPLRSGGGNGNHPLPGPGD